MACNQPNVDVGVVAREAEPKQRKKSSRATFSSEELHRRFEGHVVKAQQLFLLNDKDGAEREATLALRIHPTDHLFALLAVIAESKGQFSRASDLRLLQAFIANDAVLWEELLHEFMQERLYYKSAVCLHRLSVLETKDKTRYRALQLQLADLYVGLGELKRAIHILVSLWNGSRFRDFEVFAMLSSLFFQLGRWNSLHRLIVCSLQSTFRPMAGVIEGDTSEVNVAPLNPESDVPTAVAGEGSATPVAKRGVSRRVRFLDDNDEDGVHEGAASAVKLEEGIQLGLAARHMPRMGTASLANLGDEGDDFSFTSEGCGPPKAGNTHSGAGASSSTMIPSMYGDTMEFRSETDKKNFLMLVNVHTELLNEQGNFLDTVRLVEFTAGCLRVPLLHLPPDLLVHLGVAYAFLGGMEQQCREVFGHLRETCPMAEYGDVLYDAANALQHVGLHEEARVLFETVRRYHEYRMMDLIGNGDGPGIDDGEVMEVRTVFTAALFAESQCEASLGNTEVACGKLCRVLEEDPGHVQSRLALGRLYMYDMNDPQRAIGVLTPRENEPPLERIQLVAELVRVLTRARKYVEAIALGVSVFELILSSQCDGDTDSVATGSIKRSTAPLSMPTLSRASSAIIPPSAISDIVNGPQLSGCTDLSGTRLSHTLATSIRASSATFRVNLARRGTTPLTTSEYGASAAASSVAGYARDGEEVGQKDSSTIFRFNRKLKQVGCLQAVDKGAYDGGCIRLDGPEDTFTEDERHRARKRQREEGVMHQSVHCFWKREVDTNANDDVGSCDQGNNADHRTAGGGSNPSADQRFVDRNEAPPGDASDGDDSNVTKYELPSLEDVSKQFSDPYMRELFIQASSNEGTTSVGQCPCPNGGGYGVVVDVPRDGCEVVSGVAVTPLRVTVRDALKVLGRAGFIELAVTVVNCYGEIGKFTEAKEFAFVVLTGCRRSNGFRHLVTMERPLRWAILRAALASGECEDAYRVGVRLLQEKCSEHDRSRILELLFGVLNRTEMGSSILQRLVVGGYQEYPPVLVLLGNRYFIRRSYIRALNMYLAAMQRRPNDVLVCFLVGVCFLLVSHQKRVRARNGCVVAAWHYLLRYQESLRSIGPQRQAEAMYNCARALQYLGLHNLSTPLYEQVAYEYTVPEQCSLALQRAARFNLYFTYRWHTGNVRLAVDALHTRR